MSKIPEWLTIGIKQILVLYSLVMGMTALAIGFLKLNGIEQSTLNLGYYVAFVVYTIVFSYKKTPEKIVDWIDDKRIHGDTTK